MATSTIPYKGIKINGNILNGNMTSSSVGIGTTELAPAVETKTDVSSGASWTMFTGRSLTAGTWFINVCAYFQKAVSSGNMSVGLADANGNTQSGSVIRCGGTGSGLPRLNLFTIMVLSSDKTLYPVAYQQSGQKMDIKMAFHALKI